MGLACIYKFCVNLVCRRKCTYTVWCWIKIGISSSGTFMSYRYINFILQCMCFYFILFIYFFFCTRLVFHLTSKHVKQDGRTAVRKLLDTSAMFKTLIKLSQYLKFTFILLGRLFCIWRGPSRRSFYQLCKKKK
jgi:hypothetical protein